MARGKAPPAKPPVVDDLDSLHRLLHGPGEEVGEFSATLEDLETTVGGIEDRLDVVEAEVLEPTDAEIAALLERGDEAQTLYPPRMIEPARIEVVDCVIVESEDGKRLARLIPTNESRPTAKPGCIRLEVLSRRHPPNEPVHLCKVLELDAHVVDELRVAIKRAFTFVRGTKGKEITEKTFASMVDAGVIDRTTGTLGAIYVEEAAYQLAQAIEEQLEDQVTRLFAYRIAQALIPSEEGSEKS